MTLPISFKGHFEINKNELSKVPVLKKIKFLNQKDQLIRDFCPEGGDTFSKSDNGYIVNIREAKEADFLKYLKQFGIKADKLD